MKRTPIISAVSGLISFILTIGFGIGVPTPVAASDVKIPCEVIGISSLDNIKTRRTNLRCDLVERGSLTDSIVIIDQGDIPSYTPNWPEIANLRDSIWIFDYQGDSKVELVMTLHSEGSALIAELYDAQGNFDRLNYTLKDGHFNFNNQVPPTVKVVAPDGWWTRDDLVNFNLHISVDGLLDAAFDMRTKLAQFVRTDNIVDFDIYIRDVDGDGRPDYDWRTVHPATGDRRILERTFLMVNVKGNEAPLETVFPWPYLGKETYGYLTSSPHQTSQPPIQVNWDTGTITTVGEFVSSRGNDSQWFLYSFNEVKLEQINDTNFESPFSWYDLAEDNDAVPELSVRFVYYPPQDNIFNEGRFSNPVDIIRYSWDQDNNGNWDYKLGLLGKHLISSIVSLPEFGLRILPYSEIPAWVANQSWDAVTFVAAEVPNITGEGIYVWDHPAWYTNEYFTGYLDSPEPPPDAKRNLTEFGYGEIPEGYRGEYQHTLQEKPILYLSTVDHKLHLRKAEAGIWTIDKQSVMRYSNLDGDNYLDQWLYFENEKLQRQFLAAWPYFLYAGENEIIIKRADVAPSLFEVLPPHNNQEWLALRQQLEANQPKFAPDDLKAMLTQFSEPEWRLEGAMLRDFRFDGKGFRFVLELQPNYKVEGEGGPDFTNLHSGTYAVWYDGSFHVDEISPPLPSASLRPATLIQLQQNPLPIVLRNDGLEDLSDAELQLWATSPMGESSLVITQTITLLAQTTITSTLQWAPTTAGAWTLTPVVRQPDGQLITGNAMQVPVRQAQAADFGSLIPLTIPIILVPLTIIGLITFAGMGSLAFYQSWKKSLSKEK